MTDDDNDGGDSQTIIASGIFILCLGLTVAAFAWAIGTVVGVYCK